MRIVLLALLLCGLCAGEAAGADEVLPDPRAATSRSGFDRVRSVGGPHSTASSLQRHDSRLDGYRLHFLRDALEPYYQWKRRLNDRFGLALGLDYNVLYQVASEGITDQDGASGVLRIYGVWTFLGRGCPTSSRFVFRVEQRHRLGTAIPPTALHTAIGSLLPTAAGFSDWGWGVTNLQWQQYFSDGRIGFAFGQLDARDWIDPFPLVNWRTDLLSEAIKFPTNPLPSPGIGVAAKVYPRKRNTPYVFGGVFDANGSQAELDFQSFFEDREHYATVAVGWTPSHEERNAKNVRLSYWHRDRRVKANTPEGWGLSFSAYWTFCKRWKPFLRAGWADGGVVATKAAVSAGVGLETREHDLLGVAAGWATPDAAGLRDQATFEAFWRVQISPNLSITPDLQLLINPSLNPAEDLLVVFGLRAQLAF